MINALLLVLLLCPCPVKRDKHGRIIRNQVAVREFKRQTGYPKGRPGYVVDHIIPLCACGADSVPNMQWQRADSAKVKDRLEISACNRLSRQLEETGFTGWKVEIDGRIVPLWDH